MDGIASLPAWFTTILRNPDITVIWSALANYILEQAKQAYDPQRLESHLLPLDRVLAEAAWEVWERFPDAAPRTVESLQTWWATNKNPNIGRAVLILDALSLRELPLLLTLFKDERVEPLTVKATAAEAPTDTDHFAAALNLSRRSKLNNATQPSNFVLASNELFTAVLDHPFADCVTLIPPMHDVVIWHSWLDDHLHSKDANADAFEQIISQGLTGEGAKSLWALIQALRQGRRLLITSDHGYANTKRFAHNEFDGPTQAYLRKMLHRSRCSKATDEPTQHFMPPVLLTHNKYHIALGQRTWTIQSGYPELSHGGFSLLEAFVPFIELATR